MKKGLNSYTTKVPHNTLCLGQYQTNIKPQEAHFPLELKPPR